MLVAGDVFREPAEAAQLAPLFGAGVHVLCTVVATLGVAATDALPPERRGALATTVLCLYGVLVFAATYSAVWLWCNLRRSPIGWMKVCVTAAYGVPGAVQKVVGAARSPSACPTGSREACMQQPPCLCLCII